MGLHKHALPRWRISPWSYFKFSSLILNYQKRSCGPQWHSTQTAMFSEVGQSYNHDSPWNRAMWLGRNMKCLHIFFLCISSIFLMESPFFTFNFFYVRCWVLRVLLVHCSWHLLNIGALEHWNVGGAGWLIAWCTGKTSPLALSRSQTKWNWLSWSLNRNSWVIWATCFSFF